MAPLAIPLVSLAIKASVLLSLGLLIAALPRISAAARHLTLLAALVSTLTLPVISASVPDLEVPILEPASETRSTHDLDGAHRTSIALSSPSSRLGFMSALATSLWTAWIVGACVFVLRAMRSWLALHALLRRAQPVLNLGWLGLLDECCEKLSLPRPQLLLSEETDVALACGWLNPVIVLPVEAAEWSEARRRAVLLHELSHVGRRDALTQFVAQIARALYFWNPLAVIAERRLREEREYACDDRVLACGHEPATYAATLVDVAEGLSGHYHPVAPAMARASQLEMRVLAVLDSSRRRDGVSVAKAIVVGVPAIALLLSLASLRAAESGRSPAERDRSEADFGEAAASVPPRPVPPPPVVGPSGIHSVTIMSSMSPPDTPAPLPSAFGVTHAIGGGDGEHIVEVSVDATGQLQRRHHVNGRSQPWTAQSGRQVLEALRNSNRSIPGNEALAERIETELAREIPDPVPPD